MPTTFSNDSYSKIKHIAMIMDGNGRWAKKRGMFRTSGHEKGADTVRMVITESRRFNIANLTLFAFSTENWKRDKTEVSYLMQLLNKFLESERHLLLENEIRLVISGEIERLPAVTMEKLNSLMEETKNFTKMNLNLALSYGGRQEILMAVKKILIDYKKGNLNDALIKELTQELFSNYLYTKGMPDPDLLIRTGGDLRVSNFLLWQMAYTEFSFTKTLWPDFTKEEYFSILDDYTKRERRFGLEGSGA
jgi:undecaprenyl diphosphate synthase